MRTLFQSTQKTERECAFCVLKNQDNMIKKKRNPRVLFRNVAYKLSEIEGKTLTETASFLGFGNSEVCRSALYKWKRKKWDDFPLFTKKIFINTTQRDYNKADAVVKFLESIPIEMEYKKGLNIVIQALNELKDSLKNQVLGVIDNQILFPNDKEDTK